jgi:CHASE3 domain sensor protein
MTSKEQKKIEKASTKKVDDKELAKRIKKIVAKINENTSVIDEFLDYYNSRYDDVDYVVEKTIEMVEKKIGLVKSGLDK